MLSLASIKHGRTMSVIGRNLTNPFTALGTGGLPLSGGTTGCKTSVCGTPLVSDQNAIVSNPRTVAIQLNYKY